MNFTTIQGHPVRETDHVNASSDMGSIMSVILQSTISE